MGVFTVKISSVLICDFLTTDHEFRAGKIIKGIPEGSKLIGARLHREPVPKGGEVRVTLELEFINSKISGYQREPMDIHVKESD